MMSEINPSDELRKMLDESGVEWWKASPRKTKWHSPVLGGPVAVSEWNGKMVLDVGYVNVTPEQAIAATLGRGACHAIISDNLNESEGMGDAWADCSECGHLLFVLTDPTSEPPNYCPNCGRKVVDPTTNGADAGVTNG